MVKKIFHGRYQLYCYEFKRWLLLINSQRYDLSYHHNCLMVFKATITIGWNVWGQPSCLMVFWWFWGPPTIVSWWLSTRPERWIVTIPSSDQWLATIGNHWKTIDINGFWTQKPLENHCYQWFWWQKPLKNHYLQWFWRPKTIVKPLISMVTFHPFIQWQWWV